MPFHRCEIEVVQASGLAPSLHSGGGKPDPFVTLTFPAHPGVTHRTRTVGLSTTPAFTQKFTLDPCGDDEAVVVALYDRELSPQGCIGRAQFSVGACRAVGSRWLALAPPNAPATAGQPGSGEASRVGAEGNSSDGGGSTAPRVHIVWQWERDAGTRPTEAAAAPPPTAAALQAAASGEAPSAGAPSGADGRAAAGSVAATGAAASAATAPTAGLNEGVVTDAVRSELASLTATVTALANAVERLASRLDGRLAALEARVLRCEVAGAGRAALERAAGRNDAAFARCDSSLAAAARVSAAADADGASSPAFVSAAAAPALAPGSAAVGQSSLPWSLADAPAHSALGRILAQPTAVSAEDEKVLAAHGYRPVPLPAGRGGGATTALDAGAPRRAVLGGGGAPTLFERQLDGAVVTVSSKARDIVGDDAKP